MASRRAFAALALLTVATGLAVHRGAFPLAPTAGDVAGDALWAAMVYWIAGALAPRAGVGTRAGAALAFAWLVEFGQLVRAPWLVALRSTTLGHLVFGADFDARDLWAYALGVAAAAALELAFRWATGATRPRRAEAR